MSISLGSSKRDKKVNINLFNEYFEIERIGTDGNIQKMMELFKNLDGKIDAFGLGGTDFYIRYGNKKITLKEVGKVIFLASIIVPIAKYLPHNMLYPIGEEQEKITPKFEKYYKWADIIAVDCIYIKKHMPSDLSNKIIITNTTTEIDRFLFKERKVKMVITTTPEFNGRTFGTNVIEAIICAYYGKRVTELNEEEYFKFIKLLNLDKPNLYRFY